MLFNFLDEKASEFDKGKIATQAELGIFHSLYIPYTSFGICERK